MLPFLIQVFLLPFSLKIHTTIFSLQSPTNKCTSTPKVIDKQYILFWLLIFFPKLISTLPFTWIKSHSSSSPFAALPLKFDFFASCLHGHAHLSVFLYLLLTHFICRNPSFATFKDSVLSFLSLFLVLIHWPNPTNFFWLFFEKSYKSFLPCS